MFLLGRQRQTTQPFGPSLVDWQHPLANGLAAAVYPSGGKPFDASGMGKWTLGASAQQGIGPKGREFVGDGNAGLSCDRNLISTTATDYTVAFLVSGGSGTGMLLSGTDGANGIGQNGSTYYSWMTFEDFGPATVGKYDLLIQTRIGGGNHVQYFNGKQVRSSAVAQMIGFGGNTVLMCRGGPGGVSYLGNMPLALLWRRGLSASEVAALAANPWQLFLNPARRAFVPLAASSSNVLAVAGCLQASTVTSGSVSQAHALQGQSPAQGASVAAAAIVQTQVLTAAALTGAGSINTGAASLVHILAGSTCSQPASISTGAVAQVHQVQGGSITGAAALSTGAIQQNHVLSASAVVQASTCSTGSLDAGTVLSASTCSQSAAITSGGVGQIHLLQGQILAGAATATSTSIVQTHLLSGQALSQSATCTTGALATGAVLAGSTCNQSASISAAPIQQVHALQAAPSIQDSIASASAIVQQQFIAAGGLVQPAHVSVGSVVSGQTPAIAAAEFLRAPVSRLILASSERKTHLIAPARRCILPSSGKH